MRSSTSKRERGAATTRQAPLTRGEARERLICYVAEVRALWEQQGLDWAFRLSTLLRVILQEASKEVPDREALGLLREELCQFFKRHDFVRCLGFAVDYVDVVCGTGSGDVRAQND